MSSTKANMFTAKKTKLHGMKSSKWTTRDKIIQYKGLINLYTRDRKIMEVDTNISRKKLQRELKDLAKQVHTDRGQLDNAVRGDKQQLRNTLADHREFQLAYQNSQPEKVIENMEQKTFIKRKVLDKLIYNRKLKAQQLTDLKLEQSVLEDRLKYAFLGQIQQEKDAQIITGKVQEATLRREGALAIRQIYKEIIDIMKKDALYFDAIMNSITVDGYAQSKCFLGATKLGQLATEYLDDRRQEYDTLETIILKDMTTRKNDIKILREQVENATFNLKLLIRKDSDINTCSIHVDDSTSMEVLRKEVDTIEKTLQFLKVTTEVAGFGDIFPCLKEQLKQYKRLRILTKKCDRDKDILQNKLNHAEIMRDFLHNTMIETTLEYKNNKQDLIYTVNELIGKREHFSEVIIYKRDLAAKLRIGLRQLLQLSYQIKTGETEEPKKKHGSPPEDIAKPKEIPPDEIDGCKIIVILMQKFTYLMHHYQPHRQTSTIDDEFKHFEWLMVDQSVSGTTSIKEISGTSLLQGLFTETNQQLLTREEMKRRSKEIVAANTRNEDLIPQFLDTRTKSRFNFNKK